MTDTFPSVVVLGAGCAFRMKGAGAKPLIKVGREAVLERLVRQVRARWSDAPVAVVAGFQLKRVQKLAASLGVRVVENARFEDAGLAWGFAEGLRATGPGPSLIVYGDLVFGEGWTADLEMPESSCLYGESSQRRLGELGLCSVGGFVTNLSYGLPVRWGQVALLQADEKDFFLDIMQGQPNSDSFTVGEVFQKMMRDGCSFRFSPLPTWLIEIDTMKDIEAANAAVRKERSNSC